MGECAPPAHSRVAYGTNGTCVHIRQLVHPNTRIQYLVEKSIQVTHIGYHNNVLQIAFLQPTWKGSAIHLRVMTHSLRSPSIGVQSKVLSVDTESCLGV